MERRLKERLIGAAVLVMLAVIFIPMLLDDSRQVDSTITHTNIPAKPVDGFSSRIVPLQEPVKRIIQGETRVTKTETKPEVGQRQETKQVTQQETGQKHRPEAGTTRPEKAPAPQRPAHPVRNTATVGLTAWVVQLGSFSNESNANALNEKLRKAGFTAFVEPLKKRTKTVYRVRVGPELKRSDALTLRDKLKKATQIEGLVIHYP
ncbi:MAG: SPOR domain-containing protein [Gammaproteobacteria bacterium]